MSKTKVKTVASFDAEHPNEVRVEWADGKTLSYNYEGVDAIICAQAMHHGFTQKLMDAHSGLGEQGVAGCRAASQEVWENLREGNWNLGRQGVGGWIVEAISAIFKIDAVEAKAQFDALDDATKKAVAKDPQIVTWKAERDLKRAKSNAKGTKSQVGTLFK